VWLPPAPPVGSLSAGRRTRQPSWRGTPQAVRCAERDGRAALTALRHAWTTWQELETPYEAARVRIVIGLACRALGDRDGAEMEFDAARWTFTQLGAGPDLSRVEAIAHDAPPAATANLTARELQVLRLVAAGKSNRTIAADLNISERTVERHVSNIFAKLEVSSRAAAATTYAYQHELVCPLVADGVAGSAATSETPPAGPHQP
jgi:DNA-binding CsgD family transcriptional regulator